MIWEELTKTALLGVERDPLSERLLDQFQKLGIDVAENTTTQTLLEAVAYYSQIRKIDVELVDFRGNLPPSVRTSPYPVQYINSTSARHFQQILTEWQMALPEFSLHAKANGLFLLPELLPTALNFVREHHKSWNAIAPLMEETGWWLLNKNEYWMFLKDRSYQNVEMPMSRIQQATQGIKDFQESVKGGRTYLDQSDWLKLKKLAFYADLKQYDVLLDNWDRSITTHPFWNNNLNQIFLILDFRRAMVKALQAT